MLEAKTITKAMVLRLIDDCIARSRRFLASARLYILCLGTVLVEERGRRRLTGGRRGRRCTGVGRAGKFVLSLFALSAPVLFDGSLDVGFGARAELSLVLEVDRLPSAGAGKGIVVCGAFIGSPGRTARLGANRV